jgi:uncharacterized protein (TIGR02246 family)
MSRLLVALCLVPALALGAEQTQGTAGGPMAGWVPPKVKAEAKDKEEIHALLHAMEAAGKNGDLDAAAGLVDFPVTMITDDSKGEAKGETWDRERWTEVMRPFYAKPMKDLKVTHKPNVFLLSDSLASVNDVATMTHGGKTVTARSSMTLIRREGKWRVKTMAEGGWGDVMAARASTETAPTHGTGSGGTGSGAEPPTEHGTGGPQSPMERTTK